MHLQQPFIDQSFFHKLDQLSPDNPLYFMQQSQQHQEHLRSLSDENEDEIMRDGFPDADLNMTFSQQHSPEQQGQAPYVQQQQKSFVDSVNASTCSTGNSSNSIVEPLQPNTVPTSEGNQTFWSGINNVSSKRQENKQLIALNIEANETGSSLPMSRIILFRKPSLTWREISLITLRPLIPRKSTVQCKTDHDLLSG